MFPFPVVFDIFTETFGNIFADVLFIMFILIGVILGIFVRPWFGNQVLKLHPKDHRFDELDVEMETAVTLECKAKKGMPAQRFLKWQPGFTSVVGRFVKKPKTLFLAMEGTAYTQFMTAAKEITGTMSDALKAVWGEEFYNTVPEDQRLQLEKDVINVTVSIDPELTPENMKPITEEDIKSEQDRSAAETLWRAKSKEDKRAWVNLILAAGTGAAVVFGLFMVGLFKTPVIIVPSNAPVNGTATTQAILSVLHFLLV